MSQEFKNKLDHHYTWPALFPFKFVVKKEHLDELQTLLTDEPFTSRPSANGKYVSLTLEKNMASSDEVLALYEKVKVIPGLIAL
ncbi:MAG: DUF493 family protein [Blastochloris sp.]|nr:DUF493 family protein [Blastochloris sp.]